MAKSFTKVKNNANDTVVAACIQHVTDNFTQKNQRDTKNLAIQRLIEDAYSIKDPNAPMMITTKKAVQVVWRVINKMKQNDFTLHGVQATPIEEKLATASFSTILKKGHYDATFSQKNGMAMNSVYYGDSFRLISPRAEGSFPVQFTVVDNTNVYVNTKATSMRGTRPVTKMALIFSGTLSQFEAMFPSFKGKVGAGTVPRSISFRKDQSEEWIQRMDSQDQIIEWCYYFDIESRSYVLFAGSACTIIEKKVGKDYPYVMKEDGREMPYIPVSHRSCMPSSEGFYNHGIMDYIYDLCVLERRVFNLMAKSIEDNVNPLEIVNLPNNEVGKFFNKLERAMQERAMGRRAFIPIEQDGISNQGASLQPFYTTALVNEAQALFGMIDLSFQRMGIYLDEPESPNQTATEILSNIEKSNEFIRQIGEYNNDESEFELKMVLDMSKKFIRKTDKTPLDLTTTVEIDGEVVRADFLTLGVFRQALDDRHWFVRSNSQKGVIQSNVMRRAQIAQVMPYLLPGSKTQIDAIKEVASLNDVDYEITGETLQPPQPQEGVAAGGQSAMPQGNLAESPEAKSRDEIQFRELSPV